MSRTDPVLAGQRLYTSADAVAAALAAVEHFDGLYGQDYEQWQVEDYLSGWFVEPYSGEPFDRTPLYELAARAAAARKDEGNGYGGRAWDEVDPQIQSVYMRMAEVVVDALLDHGRVESYPVCCGDRHEDESCDGCARLDAESRKEPSA